MSNIKLIYKKIMREIWFDQVFCCILIFTLILIICKKEKKMFVSRRIYVSFGFFPLFESVIKE